jgi:hypothetical protein
MSALSLLAPKAISSAKSIWGRRHDMRAWLDRRKFRTPFVKDAVFVSAADPS